jgi:hypothetical protein
MNIWRENKIMPNFEYYRKEYLGTAQARYEQAMAMAYRDLQLEYKDAAMVRNLLLEQMSDREKLQARTLSKMTSNKKGKAPEDYADENRLLAAGYGDAAEAEEKIWDKNQKAKSDLMDEIENSYKLDKRDLSAMGEWLLLITSRGDLPKLEADIRKNVVPTMTTLTEEQKIRAVATYAPLIAGRYNASLLEGSPNRIDINTVASLMTAGAVPRYVSSDDIEDLIDLEFKDKIPSKLSFSSLERNNQLRLLGDSEDEIKQAELLRNKEILAKALGTTTTTTAKAPIAKAPTEGIDGVPLPTPEKIRARAAEYYAPFASRDFQEVVGFREPAPPKAKPEIPEEEVAQAAIEGLPAFAGKLFGASKEIESIVDLDDDTVLRQGGVGAQYGNQLLRSGDDYQNAVGKIETNENLDETQRLQAYAMLGRDLYRKFQEKSKVPSLEEIMLGRE